MVDGAAELSVKLVVVDVPTWLPLRSTRYPVTPTASVAAVQVNDTEVGDVAVPVTPEGAVGAVVSAGAPPPPARARSATVWPTLPPLAVAVVVNGPAVVPPAVVDAVSAVTL